MKSKTHELSMMGEHYLNDIMSGKKKYEGRVNTEKYRAMQVGDILKLYENEAGWGIVCEVTSLNPFASFAEMLEGLGILNLLPQLEPLSRTASHNDLLEAGIFVYSSFPGAERVQAFGCVGIGVKFLKLYR